MRHTLLALALSALGCSGGDPTTPKTDDGPTVPDEPTGDTAAAGLELTGLTGSIVLGSWPPDAYYPDQAYYGYAMFTDVDGGLYNLAGCFFLGTVCTDEWPAIGDSVAPDPDLAFFETAEFFDVDSPISIGTTDLRVDRSMGIPVYTGTPSSFGTTGGISFDGDYAAYAGTDDFVYAGPIELTSPSPSERIAAGAGGTIDLEWNTGGGGDVFLYAGDTIHHLDDDGSFSLQVDSLGLSAPFDFELLILSRQTHATIDAAGNTLQMITTNDQWLYVDYTDVVGWNELVTGVTMGETCTDALSLPPVGPGQYYGDLTGTDDDHDLGDGNSLTYYATEGLETVIPVPMQAGQTLTATYTQTIWDGSIYVMDGSCDPSTALAGADLTFDGDSEELTFTAVTAGTYYVALDGWMEGAQFSLLLDVQ